jgi:hypothetical protein
MRTNCEAAKTVPVFANRAPWNELILRGKRRVKTINFNWKYRGLVLLYTSKDRVDGWGLDDYRRNPITGRGIKTLKMADIPKGVIVGYVTVVDVVPQNTFEGIQPFVNAETPYDKFYAADPNLVDSLGQSHVVIVENPVRFKTPIPYKPPQGSVRISHAPAKLLKRPTV